MLSTILIIIIIVSVGVIGYIFFKKIPKVSAVNETSAVLKQASVKKRLLEDRLERHFKEGGAKLINSMQPLFKELVLWFKERSRRFIELEEKYRHKSLKISFKDEVAKEQKIAKLLGRAQLWLNQDNFEEAEKIYIEVLTLDERSIPAYKGLGELYILKKDYELAKQTYEFLLKLTQDDPEVYKGLGAVAWGKGDLKMAEEDYLKSLNIDKGNIEVYLNLAQVYINLEEPNKAFKMVETAAIFEPKNPRVLDFLIELSIMVQDKATAVKTFKQLKEANPENQKLSEFKERIEKM